jgi:murein DD-endopeptidase MepM/ murein hydrolase activator NlpD
VGEVVIVPNGEVAKPVASTPAASGSTPAVRGTSGPSLDGYYLRPVAGVRTQGLHGFNGVDIGASAGTEIKAAAEGRVLISRSGGWNGGYGNYVVIEHPNKTQTLYAHNRENIVSAGQWVSQGQIIGYVGSTGRSSGAHVHFEVRGAKNPF